MADPAADVADDDDILLASFLESEILSAGLDQVIVSFFCSNFRTFWFPNIMSGLGHL